MLIHHGADRPARLDRRLACSLALIAGALNSAGFYSLGFFAANMTGNVSTGADKIALGDVFSGAVYLLLPVAFIFGAALATMLVEAGLRRRIARIFALSILAEAAMLCVLGVLDMLDHGRGTVLILGLSTLMGFQNAVVTRISNWRVRTTHISGMSTDIGIGLGMLLTMVRHREASASRVEHLERLRLHGMTVLAFCVGGVLGVIAYKALGGVLLFIAAALLAAVTLPGLLRRPLRPVPPAPPAPPMKQER
ncbi:YoaK family protein [Chitinasiproducens palmae]|uniref:Uncharacterized membrane protein YoaK, UPF0700 family n=1 Tax=Chitinasiproducens palmae TaxID=1770053 RepID=A0A1H2PIG7_9BURK|nr:YoaK family protein [Chitinasiproducens palmae]SDV46034.1 Uncharacterized membrane protein YoaK, UPF0700 family [Chitinasiproducens palmae]